MIRIQKGLVKYKERSDIICTYGLADDGKTYYFLDGEKLNNGYTIASTTLVEAIDPLVIASSIGIIDSEGKVIVPFENKSIKPVANKFLLIEKKEATTPSVVEAANSRKDPLAATKLVTTSAAIKEKMYAKMGPKGRFLFNDQFSEVALCDLEGNNLHDGKLFSFVGMNEANLYLSGNTIDSVVIEHPLTEVKPEEKVEVQENNLDVREDLVQKSDIDEAMKQESVASPEEKEVEESVSEDNIKEEEPKNVFINPVSPDTINKESDFNDNSNDEVEDESDGNEEKSKVDDKKFNFEDSLNAFNNLLDDNEKEADSHNKDEDDESMSFNLEDFEIDVPSVNKRGFFDDSIEKSSLSVGLEEKNNVFEDVAAVMTKMIGQIEDQRRTMNEYEEKLKTLNEFRHKAFEENKKLVHRYESLLQEYKRMSSVVDQQGDIIEEQKQMIAELKLQVSGKNDLAKLLVRAQALLDDDYHQVDEVGYSKVKSF